MVWMGVSPEWPLSDFGVQYDACRYGFFGVAPAVVAMVGV